MFLAKGLEVRDDDSLSIRIDKSSVFASQILVLPAIDVSPAAMTTYPPVCDSQHVRII